MHWLGVVGVVGRWVGTRMTVSACGLVGVVGVAGRWVGALRLFSCLTGWILLKKITVLWVCVNTTHEKN